MSKHSNYGPDHAAQLIRAAVWGFSVPTVD